MKQPIIFVKTARSAFAAVNKRRKVEKDVWARFAAKHPKKEERIEKT